VLRRLLIPAFVLVVVGLALGREVVRTPSASAADAAASPGNRRNAAVEQPEQLSAAPRADFKSLCSRRWRICIARGRAVRGTSWRSGGASLAGALHSGGCAMGRLERCG
jgi:hypothetical protein